MASLFEAVSEMKKAREAEQVCVTLIDNSESANLTLATFDDFQEPLKTADISLKLVAGQGNIGYGAGHNLVLKDLESDYHLMLNPDVVLDKQCLVNGMAYLLENGSTAMVSPTASDQNDCRQALCKRYPSVMTLFIRGFLPQTLQRQFSNRLGHYEMHELYGTSSDGLSPAAVPIISGCFMLCRTKALKAINGFDEGYFLYFEDFDLSLRIGKRGDIAFVPSMKILHGGGYAAKKGFKHIRMFIVSGFRFFNTHGWRWF